MKRVYKAHREFGNGSLRYRGRRIPMYDDQMEFLGFPCPISDGDLIVSNKPIKGFRKLTFFPSGEVAWSQGTGFCLEGFKQAGIKFRDGGSLWVRAIVKARRR